MKLLEELLPSIGPYLAGFGSPLLSSLVSGNMSIPGSLSSGVNVPTAPLGYKTYSFPFFLSGSELFPDVKALVSGTVLKDQPLLASISNSPNLLGSLCIMRADMISASDDIAFTIQASDLTSVIPTANWSSAIANFNMDYFPWNVTNGTTGILGAISGYLLFSVAEV